jgi:hypothetical protein
MNRIIEKIKSRGYWRVVIRPSKFENARIELSHCKELVRDNAVRLRGWDYPHYDIETGPNCGLDYVEQFTDWQDHIEGWRLYQSGQFIHYVALWEDWEELSPWGQSRTIPQKESLSIISTVYLLTEIYEFASRLGAKGVLGNSCEIQITLSNTKDRKLKIDPRRPLFAEYQTSLNEIPIPLKLATVDLMSSSAELSLKHIVMLFQRFNWLDVQADIFREDQRKLFSRSF